ncbi:MAG: WYL domain-containing protein [Clostridia bacterium]|nr:WYL domain-containing protein [Clostridia bacterium]
MKQEKAYKIKLVKILEILRQDSDEDHYMPTPELLAKLAAQGIECERRTLYLDIQVLNDFGYEVLTEKRPGKPNGYCIVDRNFDVPELRILMDAVQAASFVTPKKTEVLLDKIADLGGSHRAELLKSNIVKFNTVKSSNESIFYSINEITQAIEQGKKVSFKYFDYDENRNRVYRKDNKRYFVNPLATVFSEDNYYLIGYYGKHEGVVHFRIDRMDVVELVPDQPKDPYKGEDIDLTKHKRQLFGMYQGNGQEVEFLADKSILDPIFDKFGESIELTVKADGKVSFKAEVQVSNVFFGWCLSFGDKLKVTAPEDITSKIEEYIGILAKQYSS